MRILGLGLIIIGMLLYDIGLSLANLGYIPTGQYNAVVLILISIGIGITILGYTDKYIIKPKHS